jgi:hypothetical protein
MGMIKVSEEQKKVFIETCEKYVKNGGSCNEIDCTHCPFSCEYQDNSLGCFDNRCASHSSNSKDPKLVESAKKYLKDNKPEITLEQALKVVEMEFGKEVVEELHNSLWVDIDIDTGFALLKKFGKFECENGLHVFAVTQKEFLYGLSGSCALWAGTCKVRKSLLNSLED